MEQVSSPETKYSRPQVYASARGAADRRIEDSNEVTTLQAIPKRAAHVECPEAFPSELSPVVQECGL